MLYISTMCLVHHLRGSFRLPVASRTTKQEGDRRLDPASSRSGLERFRNRLVDWGIPEAIIDDFVEHHTLLSYRKGAVIFPQGSASELLSWVQGGVVEIAFSAVDSSRILTRLVGPGEIFGHLSLVAPHRHIVHAFESRAHTDCQIAVISHDRVVKALQAFEPATLVRLLQNITTAWAETAQYWVRFVGMNYQQRLLTIFVDLVSRFGVIEGNKTRLSLGLGHHHLAEMVGCSRPMVSQLIATMLRARKIEQRGKYYILLDDTRT